MKKTIEVDFVPGDRVVTRVSVPGFPAPSRGVVDTVRITHIDTTGEFDHISYDVLLTNKSATTVVHRFVASDLVKQE